MNANGSPKAGMERCRQHVSIFLALSSTHSPPTKLHKHHSENHMHAGQLWSLKLGQDFFFPSIESNLYVSSPRLSIS